jgi:hypothetical protein
MSSHEETADEVRAEMQTRLCSVEMRNFVTRHVEADALEAANLLRAITIELGLEAPKPIQSSFNDPMSIVLALAEQPDSFIRARFSGRGTGNEEWAEYTGAQFLAAYSLANQEFDLVTVDVDSAWLAGDES